MSSEKPDQIQASVAAALSRLRGDLGPSSAAAPKLDTPPQGDMGRDMARPANDVRADPFFKTIQSPPAAGIAAGPSGGSRGPIPMTPFARMQAAPETASSDPSPSDAPERTEESITIEMPPMPRRAPDLDPMAEPTSVSPSTMSSPSQQTSPTPASAPTPAAAATPQPVTVPAGGVSSPLSRMMRGAGGADPAAPKALTQRDLLADLPPPPISEPLVGDTETSALRRRRRNRRILAAAAVIIVVAIGAWLWRGGEQSTEVPVIAANSTPEKVKPANEEGTQVPNQNIQVLDPTIQSQKETVMPAPEQPVTPPAPTTEQPATAEQAPTVVENTAPEAGAAPVQPAPAVDVPPAPETPLATAPLPEQNENDAAGTTAVAPPAPTAPAPQPEQTAETPAKAAPAPVAAEPAPAPAPAQSEPTATQEAAVAPTVPAGSSRVQLAAGKSEDAVRKQWAELQKAHPDLLGALTLNIERVDKGAAGIFYRLQAGPVADKAAAKKLCASLKQAHQDCLVVK